MASKRSKYTTPQLVQVPTEVNGERYDAVTGDLSR